MDPSHATPCATTGRHRPCSLRNNLQELFIPWTHGGKVVLAVPGGEKDTQYLTHVVAEQGITHCFLVPSQLDALLQVRNRKGVPGKCHELCWQDWSDYHLWAVQEPDLRACTKLRHVLCGGEMMPPPIIARFQQILPHAFLHNVWGPTETTVMGTGATADLLLCAGKCATSCRCQAAQ